MIGLEFKKIIQQVVDQAHFTIIEKTPMYRFTKIPPVDLVTFRRDELLKEQTPNSGMDEPTYVGNPPLFMKDPEHSFESVMSFGHDFKVNSS